MDQEKTKSTWAALPKKLTVCQSVSMSAACFYFNLEDSC